MGHTPLRSGDQDSEQHRQIGRAFCVVDPAGGLQGRLVWGTIMQANVAPARGRVDLLAAVIYRPDTAVFDDDVIVARRHLPGRVLNEQVFPLIAPERTAMTMMLPSRFWFNASDGQWRARTGSWC
ncbi:hypothetical protein PV371_33475 [Streptomyces sp. TX20-6-3]|uniref:hypothetical protein n=1 Tax=Streptomyces sp. TX20-6-3 TaxID=3028705 RepID=UPI0029BBC411|nr:hypothetical protein [Streptomyces sp. TX20-6-3]MDX2564536.1 hypothetical protein [Streptomyces sp. TX20-6-3]